MYLITLLIMITTLTYAQRRTIVTLRPSVLHIHKGVRLNHAYRKLVHMSPGKYVMHIKLNSTFGVQSKNLTLPMKQIELLMCVCEDTNIPMFCSEFKVNRILDIKLGMLYVLYYQNQKIYDYVTINKNTTFIISYRSKYDFDTSYKKDPSYFLQWLDKRNELKQLNHTVIVRGIVSFLKLTDNTIKQQIYKYNDQTYYSSTPTPAIPSDTF